MDAEPSLSAATIEDMVTAVDESWQIDAVRAAPSEAGHHIIYEVSISADHGPDTCYLKATQPERSATVDFEGRILGVLTGHSDLPVPNVYGVVDDHEDVPTPYVLMESLPGFATSRIAPGTLSERTHRHLAAQTGRWLADLHAIPAVDGYGYLDYDDRRRSGEPPGCDSDVLTVIDPVDEWREQVQRSAASEIDQLTDTRFRDLASALETALEEEIDRLTGPFSPALARIDHSLENVLHQDGTLTGILDWEFTIAATPGYDLVHCAKAMAGGPFLFAPSVTDRWSIVFEAMLDGYRERVGAEAVSQIRVNRRCYDLLATVRTMAHLDEWYPMVGLADEIDRAADVLRTEVRAWT